jgi:hypothetical protein
MSGIPPIANRNKFSEQTVVKEVRGLSLCRARKAPGTGVASPSSHPSDQSLAVTGVQPKVERSLPT